MAVNNLSIIGLQQQLYSAICQIKILSRAFDAIWDGEVDEDEANGFTEGFFDVVDQLEEISKQLDDFKEPVDLNVAAQIVQMQA